jgi:uncharacterized membrane protein YbjE (DUF340 family)
MKSSLIILSIFIVGIIVGKLVGGVTLINLNDLSLYILYGLMLLVGISLGLDTHVWQQMKALNFKIILVPIASILGTGLGILLYHLIFTFPTGNDLFAIGAGFGYYSFSSIYISKISGESMGIIALLANIVREVLTLVLAPVFVKYFGKIAPIAAGGATTSDTTLPVILKYSGKEYVLSSVVNGIILTLLVPVAIAFIYEF